MSRCDDYYIENLRRDRQVCLDSQPLWPVSITVPSFPLVTVYLVEVSDDCPLGLFADPVVAIEISAPVDPRTSLPRHDYAERNVLVCCEGYIQRGDDGVNHVGVYPASLSLDEIAVEAADEIARVRCYLEKRNLPGGRLETAKGEPA